MDPNQLLFISHLICIYTVFKIFRKGQLNVKSICFSYFILLRLFLKKMSKFLNVKIRLGLLKQNVQCKFESG